MGFPFNQVVYGSISLLLTLYNQKYVEYDKAKTFPVCPTDFALPQIKEYDFIIVGGGSSASLLANRLSDKFSVLVLEAGGTPLPPTYVPANFNYLHSHPDITYQWTSVKQNHSSLGINDGHIKMAMGKMLGGSSGIDGNVYNRGSPHDYDRWANLVADESWKYENLVKYFKKFEKFTDVKSNDHLGTKGELTLSSKNSILNPTELNWQKAWFEAGKDMGYKVFENSNGPQTEGFGPFIHSITRGQKVGAYDAFLKTIKDRRKLKICKYAKAIKIDIDENKRAVGVIYEKHGIKKYVKALKEIIISGGVFNSPHILMNSGIGPESQLKMANIKVRENLSVGQFWQDHPMVLLKLKMDHENYPKIGAKNIQEYIDHQKGALSNVWGCNSQAFLVTETAKKDGHNPNWPDMQYSLLYNSKELANGDNSLIIVASLNIVKSFGTLSLNTTHPSEPLIWDPNYLREPRDLNALVEGTKIAAKIAESNAFRKIGARIDHSLIPGCENEHFGTDSFWTCFVKSMTVPHWHVSGGCKMGQKSDTTAVVDSQLKVKGILGLRVIDNSIMPTVVNTNPIAAAYVIAEKGADMILNDY